MGSEGSSVGGLDTGDGTEGLEEIGLSLDSFLLFPLFFRTVDCFFTVDCAGMWRLGYLIQKTYISKSLREDTHTVQIAKIIVLTFSSYFSIKSIKKLCFSFSHYKHSTQSTWIYRGYVYSSCVDPPLLW